MENGWGKWVKKNVFIRLNIGKVYTGKIESLDLSTPPITFLVLRDKFNEIVRINPGSIVIIQEEEVAQ